MTHKKVHGIGTCEECEKILLIIAKQTPIRFNRLLKECQKNIEEKFSAPRLQRHLKGLERNFVKRTEKGHQQVVYSVTLPKYDLKLGKLDLEQNVEKLRKLTLIQIVNRILELHNVLALGEMMINMERLLDRITNEERSFALMLLRGKLTVINSQLELAMVKRDKSEYLEILKSLKDRQTELARACV